MSHGDVPLAGGVQTPPALRDGARLGGLRTLINVATINTMRITFDRVKRQQALRERGLDFRQAKEVFAGPHLT